MRNHTTELKRYWPILFYCALSCSSTAARAASPTLDWIDQFGTTSHDFGNGVSTDGLGSVYITGETAGSLWGPNAGGSDAYIRKYDTSGMLVWTNQLGSGSNDSGYGVSADGLGNVFISGSTRGSLGGTNAGVEDAFVSRYDASGTLLWTKQMGTRNADIAYGVAADGLGNVYITGRIDGTLDARSGSGNGFLSKYDSNGALLWTEQLGTSGYNVSMGVTVDGLGNVYITGGTDGSLGGPNVGHQDVYVRKYDPSGTVLWTRQVGSSSLDRSYGVSADDSGNIYISGSTGGKLGENDPAGLDGFVSVYDPSGTLLWTTQLDLESVDEYRDVPSTV